MKYQDFGLITVGQRHTRSLDAEGAEFTWRSDWVELTLTFRNPSLAEQWAVESGVFEVALNVVEQVPFLCFRIFQVDKYAGPGRTKPATLVLPWQECPFHLCQLHPEQLPNFDPVLHNPNFQLPLAVVLTDLETKRVRAVRQFALGSFLSRSFVEALLKTFPHYTRLSYPNAVDRILAKHQINTIGDSARIRCRSEQ
ncbi:hypothetical protein [Thermoleptolyngbya sp. C42_A2020_037]|uniref:hypothetical protein n=1 Tax=Thermoleptolyngbya sp. C42_A2020_037 TaxID=2747799 RepID=UPI0019F68AF8|nr:hypothetical protein [Thermoleptolyngbya sp. C42_A2020_037]MBF2086633.1 hypothetical protein [Thermoleptolyngbya sp. C42_A2020_037]